MKNRKDNDTEAKVNIGLFLEKFTGRKVFAEQYMKKNAIPDDVVARVLEQPELRRPVRVATK